MRDVNQARRASRQINLELVRGLGTLMDLDARPPVTLAAGQLLIRKGDIVQRLPLVVDGAIDALIHQSAEDGNAVVPVSWGAGELAMLSYLYTNDPCTVDIVAARDTVCRWLPIDEVEQSLARNRELLVMLVRFLTQRLRDVQARERSWLERGVHERVCGSIARLVAGRPRNEAGRVVIDETHESLAARCGVSRPRLSKELKRLEDEARLQLGRGVIEIVDLDWFDDLRW